MHVHVHVHVYMHMHMHMHCGECTCTCVFHALLSAAGSLRPSGAVVLVDGVWRDALQACAPHTALAY